MKTKIRLFGGKSGFNPQDGLIGIHLRVNIRTVKLNFNELGYNKLPVKTN